MVGNSRDLVEDFLYGHDGICYSLKGASLD